MTDDELTRVRGGNNQVLDCRGGGVIFRNTAVADNGDRLVRLRSGDFLEVSKPAGGESVAELIAKLCGVK